MSEIKSLSVGNGDMFYINHNTENFSMIDCNITDERKSEILDEVKNLAGKKDIVRFISTHPDQDHIQGIEILMNLGLSRIFIASTIMFPSPRRLRALKSIMS